MLIFVLSTLCSVCFSFGAEKARADAPKHVELVEFQQFNINTEDSRNELAINGKYGILLRFAEVLPPYERGILSDDSAEVNGSLKNVNLADVYSDKILINDLPLSFYSTAELCYYGEDYIWIYVFNMDIYRKISVKTEFTFLDRIIEPFTLYAKKVSGFTFWTEDSAEFIATNTYDVNYQKIEYNNIGYKYFHPKNGLLIEYDRDLSSTLTDREGGLMKINLLDPKYEGIIENDFLGAGESVGEKILIDGVPIKDIPDAEISYHSQRFLWLYVPDMINHSTVEIVANTLFINAFLPGLTLYSNGNEWLEYDPNAPRAVKENVSYVGIEWNNFDFGHKGGKCGILLQFNKNLSKVPSEYLGGTMNVNKVTTGIGAHVKLNGTPLNSIAGAEICYHNERFLWLYIPAGELSVAGGTYPHLTIDADTEFLNAVLPAVSIYFNGSYWQETAPVPSDFTDNAFSGIVINNVTIDENEGYIHTVISFENDFTAGNGSRPNFAQIGDAGERITVNGKTLHELYELDSNTRCAFDEGYGSNTLLLIFRKADLFPTGVYTTTTLTVTDGTKVMDCSLEAKSLYLVDGKWAETDAPSAPITEDKVAPYIYYYGEEDFLVFTDKTGYSVTDFISDVSALSYAFDECDGIILFDVEIPSEATTADKWNRGEWTVKIIATDAHANVCEKEITVTAIRSAEEFLSVYVNGIFSYRLRYGEKIGKDKCEELANGDPEKVDSAESYYVFTGWKVEGEFWDFENDVVTEDVWLSPTFREYNRLYTVTVTDSDKQVIDASTLKYGEVIDFAEYEKDGYDLVAKVDGAEVKRVTVNGDLFVELQYTPVKNDNGLLKAILILAVCWLGSTALILGGVIIYKKYIKKGGKE